MNYGTLFSSELQKMALDWSNLAGSLGQKPQPMKAREGIQFPAPREMTPPMNMSQFKGFPQTMKQKVQPQWAPTAMDRIEAKKTQGADTTERGIGGWSSRGNMGR